MTMNFLVEEKRLFTNYPVVGARTKAELTWGSVPLDRFAQVPFFPLQRRGVHLLSIPDRGSRQ